MIRVRHVAVLAALVLASAVPATSGAWTATIGEASNAATTAPYFACADAYAADKANAVLQWSLGDGAGATAATDASGHSDAGSVVGAVSTDAANPIACPAGGGTAMTLSGTQMIQEPASAKAAAPNAYTIEVWFKTASRNAWLIGFGDKTAVGGSGTSTYRDRMLYIDRNGNVQLAMAGASTVAAAASIAPAPAFADGRWHHAVGTYASGTMALWVDGTKVATTTGVTPLAYQGTWRVGYDSLAGSGSFQLNVDSGANGHFAGSLRWAAAYRTVLSDAAIRAHFAAGSPAAAR